MNERKLEKVARRYGQPRRCHHTLDLTSGEAMDWLRGKESSRGEVVLVIQYPNGKVLLHTKSFYPPGVYRLPSGGIGRGEGIVEAALREVREETGLEVEMESFLGLLEYDFRRGEEKLHFISYIFLLSAPRGEPMPSDADEGITAFREVAIEELKVVAQGLRSLPGEWADWGRFRALAHELAFESLETRSRLPARWLHRGGGHRYSLPQPPAGGT